MRGVSISFPKVVGKQVYGSLYECDEDILKDNKKIEEIIKGAAREGNMNVLDIKSWKIGEGASIVAIILESHITVHTWPEYKFATVDVYSCGAHTDPYRAFMYIVEKLGAKRYTINEADRSSEF
ncbi:S-adenosylmethionine decarboxylase proenzyme [Sulfolobus sp. A20]|uniref:adenosylmethionine decarboxylase n=1 Tax=Sulfolobaceae TaxID=118883 RepID=UPI0008460AF4|nr:MULTISPECIES: adenosylmethionine decarboxylase [unclassified Sulfolobus]TRM73351.1 adenosylmethionine decarboxylase [Sulfolobus sp. A20-N-F8]TRM76254.1 adenosylmethionine decarboxylase [Sulfolobus sp. E5]TRM80279.1 adenosylmethionine decarboxylase [Sulfolobus sp. D5]TRM87702.1 adenosylmethionine decarboxylase [Sulfolobus sp. C3]TRN02490.1 adenosylmethionine decarboxylase [Sulfolobus sp. E1]TRN03945.1 adenosylmethionine decarboxylase [Sulfolobus sp. F1]